MRASDDSCPCRWARIVSNKLRSVLTLVGIVAGRGLHHRRHDGDRGGAGHDGEGDERPRRADLPGAEVAGAASTRDDAAAARHAPAAAHAGGRRTRSASRSPSVDLVGSELWDFGFRSRVQGRDHQPERLDLRRHAGVPAQQHPLRRRWGGTSRAMDVRSGRRVAVIGYAIGAEALPVHRSDRQDDPRRRPQVRGDRRLRREEVGLRRHFDNYVLIPITPSCRSTA